MHIFVSLRLHQQLTKHDREAILGGALAFGGDYRNDLTMDVTHLITMVPEGVCIRSMSLHSFSI